MLCYIIFFCIILLFTVFCDFVLYYVILNYIMLYYIILYYRYYIIFYCTVLYCIALYCIIKPFWVLHKYPNDKMQIFF